MLCQKQKIPRGDSKRLIFIRKRQSQKHNVQLLEVDYFKRSEAAAVMLAKDFNVCADVWSMTSANELYRGK